MEMELSCQHLMSACHTSFVQRSKPFYRCIVLFPLHGPGEPLPNFAKLFTISEQNSVSIPLLACRAALVKKECAYSELNNDANVHGMLDSIGVLSS